jgi:hypothetical protein
MLGLPDLNGVAEQSAIGGSGPGPGVPEPGEQRLCGHRARLSDALAYAALTIVLWFNMAPS